MKIWDSSSSESRPCIICGQKTGQYKVYDQSHMSIRIPCCRKNGCYEKVNVEALADMSLRIIKREIKQKFGKY